ncbi:MAG: DUF177 domain-containing protein [Bacilli bacterium]|nr:DUF177 domain-containing protein [Bacilli bacterium]
MKINRATLKENEREVFEDDIDFSKYPFNETHVRKVENVHALLEVYEYGTMLRMMFHIKADVTAVCSYSLEDVPLAIKVDEELYFSDQEEDSEDLIFEKNNIIDMDPHILSLILAKVPIKVIKKGAKPPVDGNGYRVMSEDDYVKEREERKDPRWSALDDIEL